MKAEDIIKLADKLSELKKPNPTQDGKPRRQRTPRHMKHMDDHSVVARLQRALNEADLLQQVLEDRGKAKKKEDKKEKPSVFMTAVILMSGYPIIGAIGFLFWWLK